MGLPVAAIYILTFLWIAVTGSGAILLMYGLRGRVADRHLRCRRCKHLYINGGSDPSRCTECGGDLREPGSLRIGRRRINEGQLIFSIMLLAMSAAAVVGVVRHKTAPAVLTIAPIAKAANAPNQPNGSQSLAWFPAMKAFEDINYNSGKRAGEQTPRSDDNRVLGLLASGTLMQSPVGVPREDVVLSDGAAEPVNRSDWTDDRRQRPTSASASTPIQDTTSFDPLAEWNAAAAGWLSPQFDSNGGRSRLTAPAFEFDITQPIAFGGELQWTLPESSIATSWSSSPSNSAVKPVRTRVQATSVKPASAVSSGRVGGKSGGR